MTDGPTHPTLPVARYGSRIEAASTLACRHALDGLLVGVGSDLRYLTGYEAMPLERLTMLVVPCGRPPALVVPRLEAPAARAGLRTHVELAAWDETGDPYGLALDVLDRERLVAGARLAVSDQLWAAHLLRLQAHPAAPGARFEPLSRVLRELRMIKDDHEIGLLRRAAGAADRVVAAIGAGRLVGRTEAHVATEVRERLIAEGHETMSFAIVGSGPNSASPHHEASDRVIRAGEPIVLDIGGTLGGYGSDITRTLWVTGGDPAQGPDERFRVLYAVLQGAQEAATLAVRPGVACEEIDAVARRRIEAEGYGERFIHRTGHGIGLDGHEEPYLVAGNAEPLAEGMAFSVEPGIYIEGEYGARIEDIVVCGPAGPIVLNEAPRELSVVDG